MREFTCDICGDTFEKAWSDEVLPSGEFGVVCEDCWPRFLAWAKAQGVTVELN